MKKKSSKFYIFGEIIWPIYEFFSAFLENQKFSVNFLKNIQKYRFFPVGSENGYFSRKIDSAYRKSLNFVKKPCFLVLKNKGFTSIKK